MQASIALILVLSWRARLALMHKLGRK